MKGIFYSMIIFLFLMPVILYISLYLHTSEIENQLVSTKISGRQISGYANSISMDTKRALEMTTKRSLFVLQKMVYDRCSFIPNSKKRIEELIVNGTYDGNFSSFMENSSMVFWAGSIERIGESLGYNSKIRIDDVVVQPYDSFHLIAKLNITIKVNETAGSMRLDRKSQNQAIVSIDGLVDPLYFVSTGCVFDRIIRYNGSINGVAGVDNSVAMSYFTSYENAPSFLDRLEGRTSKYYSGETNNIGMESIINIKYLSDRGFDVSGYETKSHVDYLYFADAQGYPVNNSKYEFLRLDSNHGMLYGVNLIIT